MRPLPDNLDLLAEVQDGDRRGWGDILAEIYAGGSYKGFAQDRVVMSRRSAGNQSDKDRAEDIPGHFEKQTPPTDIVEGASG